MRRESAEALVDANAKMQNTDHRMRRRLAFVCIVAGVWLLSERFGPAKAGRMSCVGVVMPKAVRPLSKQIRATPHVSSDSRSRSRAYWPKVWAGRHGSCRWVSPASMRQPRAATSTSA